MSPTLSTHPSDVGNFAENDVPSELHSVSDASSKVCLSPKMVELRLYTQEFIDRLGVPPIWTLPTLPTFMDLCIEDMRRRGWSSEVISGLSDALVPGAVMSMTAYPYLASMPTKIYIAVFTGITVYLDDEGGKFISEMKAFSDRFQKKTHQGHWSLNALAEMLYDLSNHFEESAGALILSATLNFCTAVILEHDLPAFEVATHKQAAEYPKFIRRMSGMPEIFALFAFPPSMPLSSYIMAIPYMIQYINCGNDVLSLYKEEVAGEENNTITLLASCEGKNKLDIAKRIRHDALESADMAALLLHDQPEALAIFHEFKAGYIWFHTASISRYKLNDLLSCRCI